MSAQNLEGMSAEQRRELLRSMLANKPHTPANAPLTYGQLGLLYVYQSAPQSPAYNVAVALRIGSPMNRAALAEAYARLVARHTVLRAVIVADAAPHMHIAPANSPPPQPTFVDVSSASPDDLQQIVQRAYEQPFDLYAGPLHRLAIFTTREREHVLLLTIHHIITDGTSVGILADELFSHYAAIAHGVPFTPAPVQRDFVAYAAAQKQMLDSSRGAALRDYWINQFSDEIPLLELPLDMPRPDANPLQGATVVFAIDAIDVEPLRALAKAEHASLYMLLISLYAILLSRYSRQDELTISTPMLARTTSADHNVVGFLANPNILRFHIDRTLPFIDFARKARSVVLGALDHQEYPLALLVEELKPRRIPGRLPLADVMFNLLSTQHLGATTAAIAANMQTPAQQDGLEISAFLVDQEVGQFDLALHIADLGSSLRGELKYNTSIFSHATVEAMAGHFRHLLKSAVANPRQQVGALAMQDEREQNLLAAWNDTGRTLPAGATVQSLIQAQAQRTPQAVALRDARHSLTYAQVENLSNQVAHQLRAMGAGEGQWVGVYLDRSVHITIALLGILKTGAGYLPLDPGFPQERLQYMVEESAAQLIVTERGLKASIPDANARLLVIDEAIDLTSTQNVAPPDVVVDPYKPAYLLFTSGSTGKPKGVVIPQRAVVNFLLAMAERPGLAANEVLGAVTTISFDISVLELFLPLVVGGQSVIIAREVAGNGMRLAQEIAAARITTMQATPSTWRLLQTAHFAPPAGFRAFCGGEPLPETIAAKLLEVGVELWNLYGPTETTVWSTTEQIGCIESPLPIGTPILNTTVHILDDGLAPTPIGVPGTLYIGGEGLATGYLNRPDLTAERFIEWDAGDGKPERLYNTGDIGRWRRDGKLEVFGRSDNQVKIRGFRIELGEIEVQLERHPQIREAAVVARADSRGDKRLLAYIVPEADTQVDPGKLRLFLRTSLPEYMVPSAFIPMDAFPRTANNKLDRKALPAPQSSDASTLQNWVAPATATEVAIAAIWQRVLEGARVGTHDNFFDIGGNSLNAMEVVAECDRRFGVAIHPGLFRAQTLGQLARSIDDSINRQE